MFVIRGTSVALSPIHDVAEPLCPVLRLKIPARAMTIWRPEHDCLGRSTRKATSPSGQLRFAIRSCALISNRLSALWLKDACRIAHRKMCSRHILGDDCASTDDCPVTNRDTFQDDRSSSDKNA